SSSALVELAARALPSGAGLAGRIYAQAFVQGRIDPESLGASARTAKAWREKFEVGLLEPRRLASDPETSVRKASLATRDGLEIECVLVPMRATRPRIPAAALAQAQPQAPAQAQAPPRSTLCISSQVGCRMGCAFCETGLGGLRRNLNAAEIVAQAVTARAVLGWDFSNIVFMGMGEPLDNLSAVASALAIFADPRGMALSWERLTVCSSGPEGGIPALRELGFKRLNLSISLNAADDAKRSALMPVNRRGGLERLERELAAYPQRRNFVVAVNYCLMPGLNDDRDDAFRVAAFCARIGRSIVNVIPYNPGSEPIAKPPTDEEARRFVSWLEDEGARVKFREAKGGPIMAGCGQLGSTRASTTG
ncbi:MAG: radical SAM protein, partial [Spirochaetaceae bacterium]|nr:radical SAM protein [Spirochaetaceae bacterium]